ncbi:putative bifunctional diguanylate cyclase/phosphodiesterase [Sphingobium phenoxybenzoativorans]|uniref:putative bifunctional diguanylate cyclase/phosphodiesterase n=1 Tax=Sphingobium phenoxybenzoativorans TaxID=1592790 RepID=UPI0008733D88|nr:bifunctional diguanylate cyclase/phosphodiesterase [Sphingobium phenoxybenzoativorans]
MLHAFAYVVALFLLALLAIIWAATGFHPLFTATIAVVITILIAGLALRSRIALHEAVIEQYNKSIAPQDGYATPAIGLRDVAERIPVVAKRLAETATRLPQRHPVTDLPTRELLLSTMDGDWHCAAQPTLLGIIDVLDFDRLCSFDQEAADRLLAIIASKLIRMADPRRTVAQIDRSRFAIWFAGADSQTAEIELETLSYALRNRLGEDAGNLQPQIRSASVKATPQSEKPSATLARAISALSMEMAGTTEMTDPRETARKTFWIEQQLRQAIERQEFELHYQPFIDAVRGRICGAEALLRWHRHEAGNPSPSVFIPIVERIGLAEEIGLWTLNTACRQAREWEQAGYMGLKVAVNMSAHQLARPDLDALVKRTLDQHGLKPGLLEIELTETVAAIDSTQAKALLQRIRALGVAVSIDDFGAGYSSLSYLKQLVFDKLKIDREFVIDVHCHKDSQAICQSIIALGRGLGIPVLAEGVETQDEFAWLRRHGCELFQGYYFSRPLPAADFFHFATQSHAVTSLIDIGPARQLAGIKARLA